MKHRVGIVGTGPRARTTERGGGFAIGRVHAAAWKRIEGASMIAACDIDSSNLAAFCDDHEIENGYENFDDMLADGALDFLSICTWPTLHCEMTVQAAEAGVMGIYCEKPMCISLGEADRMLDACRANGTRIAVSHQRRFEPLYMRAKEIVQESKLGRLTEMSARISVADADLLSWGTHWIDQMGFFLDDRRPLSVLAQADTSQMITRYGHRVENDSVVQLVYDDGVTGIIEGANDLPAPFFRVVGDAGLLTIKDRLVAWWKEDDGIREFEQVRGLSDFQDSYVSAIGDLVASVEESRPPALDAFKSRQTTEIIMAAYESANRGQRVNLPYCGEDFPLMERQFGE